MKTYNDVFVEQLIRCRREGRELMYKIGAVILGLVLVALTFHFFTSIFPFFFAIICILIFFMFKYTVKEYEYSFISGDIDIDMILGKRKRKRVFSCTSKDISIMEYCGDRKIEGNFANVLNASISRKSPNRWYFICEKEDGSRSLVYFNPSERMRNAFGQYLGKKLKAEIKEKADAGV